MRLRNQSGFLASAGGHAVLLLAMLLAFPQARPVEEVLEAVAVEVVDARELGKVAKGEKSSPLARPSPRVEKHAEVPEPKPLAPLAEATKDVTRPPIPAKRQPDPGYEDARDAPQTTQKVAAMPPPPRSEPKEPKPRREEQHAAAEVTPPVRAKPQAVEDAEPLDPKPKAAQRAERKSEPPKDPKPPVPAKKPEPRFEPDRLAKLLEQEKHKEPSEKPADKTPAKPRSGDEAAAPPERKFDPTDIGKFLSREVAQRKASTGQELQQVAALGEPTASAAKMSPSLWSQLDGLLQDQYKRCWTFVGLGGAKKYIPEIRVWYAANGSLMQPPELLNPPSDPSLKALADSALRAVRRCDPLRIPERYQPYYEQWKGRIVRFDPEEMV
jgi:colicin import membrane protein